MTQLNYKSYIGSIEYSEEDKYYFGKLLGTGKDYITYEGKTLAELKNDFEGAVDDYIASCAARGIW